MSIQKFVVNGEEAKIDYEGLENKPFGTPELIPVFDVHDIHCYNEDGSYYSDSFSSTEIPGKLKLYEKYKVTIDNNVYYLTSSGEGSSIYLNEDEDFSICPVSIYFNYESADDTYYIFCTENESTISVKVELISYSKINDDCISDKIFKCKTDRGDAGSVTPLMNLNFGGVYSDKWFDCPYDGSNMGNEFYYISVVYDGIEYLCDSRSEIGDPNLFLYPFWIQFDTDDHNGFSMTIKAETGDTHTIEMRYCGILTRVTPEFWFYNYNTHTMGRIGRLEEIIEYIATHVIDEFKDQSGDVIIKY